MKTFKITLFVFSLMTIMALSVFAAGTVKIGLNYPKTGPYSVQGLDQWRAAELAVAEINSAGGILGKNIEIVWRDSESKPALATKNVTDLIDNEGVKMVFGGSSSGVAVASAKVCHDKWVPFFGTLTYSTATTGKEGLKTTFRECYDAWMAAKAIGTYLKDNFPNKTYFYITADYTWGWTTESSVRRFTSTEDESTHKGIKTPFPGAKADDLQIVVPNLTLGMAEGGGPKIMEGVIGALPWSWQVPYKYNYTHGKKFVEKFESKYNRYPSTSGASAYTILYEYKAAVERANSFKTDDIIKALEGHEYSLLKDKQTWRKFDHQSVQTVYLVKCKNETEVLKDKYNLDYFEILNKISGDEAVKTFPEWVSGRTAAGKPTEL